MLKQGIIGVQVSSLLGLIQLVATTKRLFDSMCLIKQ